MAKARKLVLKSENTLRASMRARIREIGALPLLMSGSVVRTERKCGSRTCECARGGPKHPCCLLTRKVGGKTRSVYVPVDMADEVEGWSAAHRRLKELLREIDALGEEIIRRHVAARRAAARGAGDAAGGAGR